MLADMQQEKRVTKIRTTQLLCLVPKLTSFDNLCCHKHPLIGIWKKMAMDGDVACVIRGYESHLEPKTSLGEKVFSYFTK